MKHKLTSKAEPECKGLSNSQSHQNAGALVYSIPDFCATHGFSRAMLYKLWQEGRGPRVMKVGNRTLISAEAAADWRRSMEADAAAGNE